MQFIKFYKNVLQLTVHIVLVLLQLSLKVEQIEADKFNEERKLGIEIYCNLATITMNIFRYGLMAATFGYLFQIFAVWLIILAFAKSKPQDIIQSIGTGAIQIAAEAASIASNGAALFDDRGFEVPFAKSHTKTAVGAGEAILQRRYTDSSEEDQRRRRKRSKESTYLNLIASETLHEMSALYPEPHYHNHSKRAACHGGGGTTGGTGTGTGGSDDYVDVVERRKKAARKRKAAQKTKSTSSRKNSRSTKSPLVPEHEVEQSLRRRKRQTEVDDLNAGMNKTNKNISEQARQILEKVQGVWQNFMNTINEMAQQVKQTINGANQGNQEI